jgi:hypothetical protein
LREYEYNWWLIQHENVFETANGLTFVAAATSFFPRSLWPEKPLGGGPFIRNLIRPGTYNFNSGLPLTSYTTGMPAEGFMNFGRLGFVISGALFGLILLGISFALGWARSTIPFCVWLGLLYRGIDFQRSEFLGGVANTVFLCLPLLLAFWIRGWIIGPKRNSTTGTLVGEA